MQYAAPWLQEAVEDNSSDDELFEKHGSDSDLKSEGEILANTQSVTAVEKAERPDPAETDCSRGHAKLEYFLRLASSDDETVHDLKTNKKKWGSRRQR